MYKDEIIEELWANRKALVEKHDHDIDALVRDLQKRQGKTNRAVVDRRLLKDKAKQSEPRDIRH